MKKLLKLAKVCGALLVCAVLLAGCNRYAGWQYIRIEHSVPYENCEYKIQESCSGPDGHCYNWYRQKATTHGANTVVITDTTQGFKSKGGAFVNQYGGAGKTRATSTMTGLADYYYCPSRDKASELYEPIKRP